MIKNIKAINNSIKKELFTTTQKILKPYIKDIYGKEAETLYVYVEDDTLCYKMNSIKGIIDDTEKSWMLMRGRCGQSILMVKGPPRMGEPYKVKLLITPPAMVKIGILKVSTFYKIWKGQSFLNDSPIIEYV